MAAGLGFKTFTTGEVLTAGDVNGYLMQGVLVFASAAARDAAITSPQEGQFAYLKDTNVTTYYTGSAWANLDTTGMTNPMTTTGDMVYSSSGSTPARLGIGTTGQVVTVAGGIPTWATPGGGGKVLQVVLATYATQTTSTSTTFATTNLTATITPTLNTSKIAVFATIDGCQNGAGISGMAIKFRLVRGATQLSIFNEYSFTRSNLEFIGNYAHTFTDSPATTSATTYTMEFASAIATYTARVNTSSGSSNLILMEIGV